MKTKIKEFIKTIPLAYKIVEITRNVEINVKHHYNKIHWIINKPSVPNIKQKYIHLGCGNINHPKMINVDLRPDKHIHYLNNVEKLDFFPDNFADLIYVSHCLEHISHLKIDSVLTEWNRILKPNGVLRISVPNFDTIIKMYEDSGNDIFSIIEPLMGGQDYKYNFHYVTFNEQYLQALLQRNNFKNVRFWKYDEDEFSMFDDWSNKKIKLNEVAYEISLNIQAVKSK